MTFKCFNTLHSIYICRGYYSKDKMIFICFGEEETKNR